MSDVINVMNKQRDSHIQRTGVSVTIRHKYQSGTLPNGEPDYDWGGVGHEASEKIFYFPIPMTETNMQGARYAPRDLKATFRSDTTVVADDEVLIGTHYYRVDSPMEVVEEGQLQQKRAYLIYQGT